MYVTKQTTAPFMTVAEAAAEMQWPRKTVYQWIRKGLFPAGKLPGGLEIRIRRTDWDSFVASIFKDGIEANNDDVDTCVACERACRRTARFVAPGRLIEKDDATFLPSVSDSPGQNVA